MYANNYKRYFLSGSMLILGITLSAQGKSSELMLDFDTALASAWLNNPLLSSLRSRTDVAVAQMRSAGSIPDPHLRYTHFGKSVQTRTGSQEAVYSLNQTLPWLPKLRKRKEIARFDVAISKWVEEQAYLNLQRDLTVVFAEVYYLERAIRATRESFELIKEMEGISSESVRSGGSVNTLLRLAVERERVQDDLERFEREQYVQRHKLEAITASELDKSTTLQPLQLKWEELPAEEKLLAEMLRVNPELQALSKMSDQAAHRVSLERLKRYPDVTLGINYIDLDAADSTHPQAGEDPWSLSVSINLPLWERRNRADLQGARATQRAEEMHYRNRQLQLEAELGSIRTRLIDDREREKRYREVLIPLARQALDNSRSAYEAGTVGIIGLLDSERALLDLTIIHARAHADSIQNKAHLDAICSRGNPLRKQPSL